MVVDVRFLTDPACPWSWSAEPVIRKLMTEFGDELSWTLVMGGLARDYGGGEGGGSSAASAERRYSRLVRHWLDAAEGGRMPIDPRLWWEAPIASTYPACMAAKAAAEQAEDGGHRYLRTLREGLMCFRRKLDTTEALVESAREAGLDVERFRIDLGSHATVEAFGADLDEVRSVPDEARELGHAIQAAGQERLTLPTLFFTGAGGNSHAVYGPRPYPDYRAAAEAAGAKPRGAPPPGAVDALRRFGRMATAEIEAVCGLPAPPAAAELWSLATEWRVRPIRVLTGYLWELAD